MGLRFDIGVYDYSLDGFDWLGEENNTSFTYTDAELDRMVAELDALGYGDSFASGAARADSLSFDMPGRSVNIRIRRTHYR